MEPPIPATTQAIHAAPTTDHIARLSDAAPWPDLVFLTIGEDQGAWMLVEEHWDENGSPESCTVQVPDGKFQPIRGFGWIWCNDESIRKELGWALDVERAFPGGVDLVQGFDNGIVFRDSDGMSKGIAYVMFGNDQGTYVREPY